MVETIQLLSITLLQPNPFQPRTTFNQAALDELAESIQVYGILEPLIVAHTPAGYQIIAGERRWRAAKIAGLKEVPVIIRKTTPRGMLEMAIIENVQRVDFNALERARAFQLLIQDFGYNQSEIARRINKSSPYISNSLRLLHLPDAIKDAIVSEQIAEGHARALASIKDEKKIIEVYKIILKENASVRRAEELARLANNQAEHAERVDQGAKKIYASDHPAIKAWEKRVASMVKSESFVKLTRSTRRTQLVITLVGDLRQTQDDLEALLELVKTSRKESEAK
jgi:ParB family chromosome partitioning protein